jgi:prepilin-type N-terminal cleavage/methylation domain-containing protein
MISKRAFTIIELIVAIAIATILTSIAVYNFRELENKGERAAQELASFLKMARLRAMSTGHAIEIISGPSGALPGAPHNNEFHLLKLSNIDPSLQSNCRATTGGPTTTRSIVTEDKYRAVKGATVLNFRVKKGNTTTTSNTGGVVLGCYSVQGTLDSNTLVRLESNKGKYGVEIFLGGGTTIKKL